MNQFSHSWTPERKAEAARMWAEGSSARQIATKLGGGLSRNAVIGVLHRMGVSARFTASKPARVPNDARKIVKPKPAARINGNNQVVIEPEARAPLVVVPKAVFQPIPGYEPVALMDLKLAHCRWPVDLADGSTAFCGRAKTDNRYCRAHAEVSVGKGSFYERDAIRQAEWVMRKEAA